MFAHVTSATKALIVAWLAKHHTSHRPTIVKLAIAEKDLSSWSKVPILGTDTTLPQHRPSVETTVGSGFKPSQDQFPVWYLFYGTLADPAALARVLAIDIIPVLQSAVLHGGRLECWGGKYKALADEYDRPDAEIAGKAYLVQNQAHEDALRFYETDAYEVVRCSFSIDGVPRVGLTFRFRDQ
jgi:hypothetical protein